MSDILTAVRRTIDTHTMLHPGDRVLCALSGGADSVAMTHALCSLRESLQIEIRAAHFSHGIRPQAAEAERRLCQRLCASLGIGLVTGEGDTPALAAREKTGLEDAARTLRYRFLRSQAAAWGSEAGGPPAIIATAHNLGDQAETVLMNLLRGAGLQGLRGIEANSGSVIRPLVEVPRADIEAYLAAHGLDCAVDATNADNAYTRNRLRNEVMPLLKAVNAQAAEHMAGAGFMLAQAWDYIAAQAGGLVSYDLSAGGHRRAVFDVAALGEAHPALAGQALVSGFRTVTGERLARRHVEAILALTRSGGPSARLSLPGGTTARREYGRLFLEQAEAGLPGRGRAGLPSASLALGQAVRWGGWEIEASVGRAEGAWHFDINDVAFPVQIRQRQGGDILCMGKYHKTVKKLMIEEKIPKNLRDITPVLCDNKSVLCVGDRFADRGRIVAGAEPGRTVSIRVASMPGIERTNTSVWGTEP